MSRQATHRKDGRERKTVFLDKKESASSTVMRAGCVRGAAGRRALLINHGFKRLKSVTVASVHETRDMSGVVHGDDFVWEGTDEDLDWVWKVLEDKYD